MDAREDKRPFSYVGYNHGGNPVDMLEDTYDGLWAAVHMVDACNGCDPTPMGLSGLGNLLRGLAATVESAKDIVQERLCSRGKSPGAAEHERETGRLIAAFDEGAALARRFPHSPIEDLWCQCSREVREGRAEGPSRPEGKPEHVAVE